MAVIKIDDNLLKWEFDLDLLSITASSENKVLRMYWWDDFGISIDDISDEDFHTKREATLQFLIPNDSVAYNLFCHIIPNNYTIFSDVKPCYSEKRVEFNYSNDGLFIVIVSDYKAESDIIPTSLTFWGANGGSSQPLEYKNNFVKLIDSLLMFATNEFNESKKI